MVPSDHSPCGSEAALEISQSFTDSIHSSVLVCRSLALVGKKCKSPKVSSFYVV